MAAIVDKDKCTGCGTCADGCPVEAIKVDDSAIIDNDECIVCGTCVDECPEGAISLE